MIFLILTLSLILPSSTFLLATAQMLFVFIASIFVNKKIRITEYYLFLTLIFLFILLGILHFFFTQDAEEFVDIVRFMPLLSFVLIRSKLNEITLGKVFFCVNLINITAVYLVENNLLSNFTEFLHARNLEESYGRHSGIFVNVSNLGIYSLMGIVFSLKKIEKKNSLLDMIILISSGYLLLLSGSKTGLILAGGYLAFQAFRNIILIQINVISLLIIPLISGMIYYWEEVKNSFYVLYKISTILTGGIASASSVQGRFDIWSGYLTLMYDNAMYVIFGLPLAIAETFSTTFDSDIIWLSVRFGFVGFFVFLYFWAKHLKRTRHFLSSSIILVASFFVGILVSFQLCLFALCLLYYFEERSNVDQREVQIVRD
ncbi:MAG: hypothetical protein CMF41_00865 [Legionellales bacterium]|nr:hypothetical protein [Legionellales bacterium]OUX66217.1 MAG: hypothetical protein CBE41_00485 [Gammaproteobacteria bacterium TMED281]|tara:strand:- start:289 stop:1407 length:1119 start_codon:yes stop_codon:yes gene_type:complete